MDVSHGLLDELLDQGIINPKHYEAIKVLHFFLYRLHLEINIILAYLRKL